jgi:hypothetical protein
VLASSFPDPDLGSALVRLTRGAFPGRPMYDLSAVGAVPVSVDIMLFVAEEKSLAYAINTGFVGISRRAESVDRKTLVQTFVDLGPLIPVLGFIAKFPLIARRASGSV